MGLIADTHSATFRGTRAADTYKSLDNASFGKIENNHVSMRPTADSARILRRQAFTSKAMVDTNVRLGDY